MKIVGQKYLNRNDYSTITIGKDKITILGKDSYPTIKGDGTSITDEIKNLPLNEQVGEVVDYFLRYTTVCSIIDNDYVSGKKYVSVIGEGGKKLRFSSNLFKEDSKKIIQKYVDDRRDVVFNSEVVEFDLNMESYGNVYYGYDDTGSKIKIGIGESSRRVMYDFDSEFISEFVKYIGEGEEVTFTLPERRFEMDTPAVIYMHGPNKKVTIQNYIPLKNKVVSVASFYNSDVKRRKEIEREAMKLQMKMEGF